MIFPRVNIVATFALAMSLGLLASLQIEAKAPGKGAAPAAKAKSGAGQNTANSLSLRTVVSIPNNELYSPVFLGATDKLALVIRPHEPDFHEAEAYTEKELRKDDAAKKKDPRLFDPRVTIVSLSGAAPEFIDYGWNPESSKDGERIFYTHQKKPITGKRVLAEPQEGNQIFVYGQKTKTKEQLVAPTSGYLDYASLSPSGDKLAYALCDATNGAWGGTVGAGIFDLKAGKNDFVLPPEKHFELFDLIGHSFWQGEDLYVRRAVPGDKGMYLASKYHTTLINVTDKTKPIWTAPETDDGGHFGMGAVGENFVINDGETMTTIDKTGKKISSRKVPVQHAQIWQESPDGVYEASADQGILTVKSKKTGKKMTAKLAGKESVSITWQQDCSQCRLAVITTVQKLKGGEEVFERDVLQVADLSLLK